MHYQRISVGLVTGLALAACGGGGGEPVTVGAVAITAPAAAPAFATLGRTVQFAAQASDQSGAPITGAAITWSSSNEAAVTISGAGLATAAGNGSAQIRASSGGVQSSAVTVTVSQVLHQVAVTPASVAFGAIGSTRQLAAAALDSGGAAIAGFALPAFTRSGTGATATVTAGGLVTAVGVGATDTAVIGATKVPISATQVVATVTVASTVATPDTLFAATRTRQFTATARDSNTNVIAGASFAWTTSAGTVATVGATTGLVTAAADGNATIQASVSGRSGTRPMVVRRLAATRSITPPSASITTSGGSAGFTGSAADSAGSAIPISWVSRNPFTATVSPVSGGSTTATAVFNGSTQVIMVIPVGALDSATLTVSGQPVAPASASVQVADNFFRSVRNLTVNTAIDTITAGGSVTWTWLATVVEPHDVSSTGNPAFASSSLRTSGTYTVQFSVSGDYDYTCSHHPTMTGRIVVR